MPRIVHKNGEGRAGSGSGTAVDLCSQALDEREALPPPRSPRPFVLRSGRPQAGSPAGSHDPRAPLDPQLLRGRCPAPGSAPAGPPLWPLPSAAHSQPPRPRPASANQPLVGDPAPSQSVGRSVDRVTKRAPGRGALKERAAAQKRSLVKNQRFLPLLNFSSSSFLASTHASLRLVLLSSASGATTPLSSTSRV